MLFSLRTGPLVCPTGIIQLLKIHERGKSIGQFIISNGHDTVEGKSFGHPLL